MNYEKKYKEALEIAQKLYQDCPNGKNDRLYHTTDLEKMFPELRESEDEKIRKELIEHIKDQQSSFISAPDCRDKYEEEENNKYNSWLAWLEKQGEPQDKGEISDGYHTFNELYYYRMLYNAAFFNMLPKEWVHKSKKHNDGEECFGGGWFIVMANLPTGQISNHYELKDWDLFQIPEKEVADEWDGHTPQEAADRLHKYLLEKQGGKKPILDFKAKDWYVSKVDGKIHNIYYSVDKVEPKFKVGDWITDGEKVWKIGYIEDDMYIEHHGSISAGGSIESIDKHYHLWTIQDAKNGDVLTYSDSRNNVCLCIYKEYKNERVYDYCMLDKESFWEHGNWNYLASFNYAPSTKEQRDLLFQKMKEVGYEWNADKKELKKFDFSKPIKYNSNPPSIIKESDWSEEDESLRLRTIGALETCKIGSPTKCVDEQINWLKSLKGRVLPQPKQEWNEEDQNALEDVREAVVHYWDGDTQDILLYWLKSLKQKIKKEAV